MTKYLGCPCGLCSGSSLLPAGFQVLLLSFCQVQATRQLAQLLSQMSCLPELPSVTRLACQDLQSLSQLVITQL